MTPIACCVAVSERHGLDLLMMWPQSVNTEKFHTFIKRLRAKYPFRKMCLYMDNLGIHRSKATAQLLQDKRLRFIFNPPYSPFGNPIEECFAACKAAYKKARLQQIMNGSDLSIEDMIENSFKCID